MKFNSTFWLNVCLNCPNQFVENFQGISPNYFSNFQIFTLNCSIFNQLSELIVIQILKHSLICNKASTQIYFEMAPGSCYKSFYSSYLHGATTFSRMTLSITTCRICVCLTLYPLLVVLTRWPFYHIFQTTDV